MENNQTLAEKYIRLYTFTRDILLAYNLPKDFEDNYEVKLAEETINKTERVMKETVFTEEQIEEALSLYTDDAPASYIKRDLIKTLKSYGSI